MISGRIALDNGGMSRDRHIDAPDSVRKFKGSTVFDWEHEPAPERPSEFAESTSYTTLWGPTSADPATLLEARRARPRRIQRGFWTLGRALVLVGLIAGAGLFALAHWLRG
ncbi:MAG: hypothetical protein ABT20_01875 [Rubrivivax sp. SCN 70-15]|nr:MAG: hypothetical protein ABT20_01875 [Rubrivivax sp. SCN 70-15]